MIDLYYAPDNASLIVRIVLEELGIKYRAILVNRAEKQQQSEAYRLLNPKGLIPVCVIDEQPVFETAAIALLLAERKAMYGSTNTLSLAPAVQDSNRPEFLKWLFFTSNTLHPDLRHLFYAEKFVDQNEALQRSYQKASRDRIVHSLNMFDVRYSQNAHDSSGVYLFGTEPSLVDIYLGVCIRWVQLYPVSASTHTTAASFPALYSMLTELQKRPAVLSACRQEGIVGDVFSQPDYSNPPEGSAV